LRIRYNIGRTEKITAIPLTRNISATFEKRNLRTNGSIGAEYVVRKGLWHNVPHRTGITIQPPFGLDIFVTQAAKEKDIFPKVLAFCTCPQTFKIALDANIFNHTFSNELVPFQIDHMQFLAFFQGLNTITGINGWRINLIHMGKLMGGITGSSFHLEDLQAAKKYVDLARPF
jgi:hypothetical protein